MGSNNIDLDKVVTEQGSGFTQVSYLGHGSYDDHAPQTSYQHLFTSNNLFPDLNEYSKIRVTASIDRDDLSFTQEAMATLRLVETAGSFKNVVGHYIVDQNGTIRDVNIAFKNTRTAEPGLTHSFNVEGGAINFFMVAHGYSMNKVFSDLDNADGDFSFVYKQGADNERPAQITDNADDITLIYQAGDGKVSKIRGPIYHSTESEKENDLNTDGKNHTVSGLSKDSNDDSVLRIGFEDFPGLGDADYNDVVFDLSVSYLHPNFGDKQVASLNDLMPSSGDGTESLKSSAEKDDSLYRENDDPTNVNGLNNSGSGINGQEDKDNFNDYIVMQISKFSPDIYTQIEKALEKSDNPEALFSAFLKENFRDTYDELLLDFKSQESLTKIAESNINDLSDVLLTSTHIDEAINQFISLGSNDATEVTQSKVTTPEENLTVFNDTSLESLSTPIDEIV